MLGAGAACGEGGAAGPACAKDTLQRRRSCNHTSAVLVAIAVQRDGIESMLEIHESKEEKEGIGS